MRASEFLIESQTFLIERSNVQTADWFKIDNKTSLLKYTKPFLSNIMKGAILSFKHATHQVVRSKRGAPVEIGKEFLGKILNPKQLETTINAIQEMKSGQAKAIKGVTFSVAVAIVGDDGETEELTDTIVDNVTLSNIFKDDRFKGNLIPNMGNFSEALLGCAVAARFSKNGGNIQLTDIIDMGKLLKENNGVAKLTAGKDRLEFKITIPYMDEKAFYTWIDGGFEEKDRSARLSEKEVPVDTIELIESRALNAVEYANTSKRVQSAISVAKNDRRKNIVDVISDGGEKENQSITKVDLKIMIDGKEAAKRLLSVKAGTVAQFGQVSGVNYEHIHEFFETSLKMKLNPTIKRYFYEIPKGAGKDFDDQKQSNFEHGTNAAYNYIFKQLQKEAKSNPQKLVRDVYKGLVYHLTRDEQGVEMVILDPHNNGKQAFQELSFGPEFKKALNQLELVPWMDPKGVGYSLSIYGMPKGSIAKKLLKRPGPKNKLVDLVSQIRSGTIRNRLNMGGLLKVIADIENYQKQHPTEPAPQAKTNKKLPMAPVQKPVTKNLAPTKTPAAMQPIKSVGSTSAADKAAKDKAIKDKMKAALAGGGSEPPLEKKGR